MRKLIIIIFIFLFLFSFNMKKVYAINMNDITNYSTTLALDCDILTNKEGESGFKKWLASIYDFAKFLAVALAIVMSVVEFFKAIVSDKKDALQTSAKRTAIRIVLCLILFFIPNIINFVFGTILHMCGTQGIN